MMTVAEYIQEQLSRFGECLKSDIADICGVAGVNPDEVYIPAEHLARIEYGIARIGGRIYANAVSVTESGFSKSWDRNGFKAYYGQLCRRYGVKNELDTDRPSVNFL